MVLIVTETRFQLFNQLITFHKLLKTSKSCYKMPYEYLREYRQIPLQIRYHLMIPDTVVNPIADKGGHLFLDFGVMHCPSEL